MKPSSDFFVYHHDIGKPHFSAQNPWWPHTIRTTVLEYLYYTNICPCPKSPSFDSFVGLVIYQHHFVRIWDVPAGNSLVSEPKKRNTLHNVNCQMAACEEMLFQWLGKLSGPWAQVYIHALCIFCFLFLRQLLIVKIDKVSVKASKMPRSSSRNISIWSARPAYQWRKPVDKIGKRDLCCLAILTRTWQDRVPRIISVAQTDPQLRGWDHGTRERIFAWTVAWLKESGSETLTISKHQLFAHHVRCQTQIWGPLLFWRRWNRRFFGN